MFQNIVFKFKVFKGFTLLALVMWLVLRLVRIREQLNCDFRECHFDRDLFNIVLYIDALIMLECVVVMLYSLY